MKGSHDQTCKEKQLCLSKHHPGELNISHIVGQVGTLPQQQSSESMINLFLNTYSQGQKCPAWE